MLIICGMFPSNDTWFIYWGLLWKDHAVLNDDVNDHNVMTMVFSHMIWFEWFYVTAWRYDISWVDSWKVMIRLFLLRKQSKLILMRSIGWVDIYMQTCIVIGWWYLHCHILGTNDWHTQVSSLDVVDRCLWSRSYMVYTDDYHGLV